MLATQAQNQELLTENDQLKKELIAVKDWKTEAANYTLKEIIPGSFVYAINEDQLSAQPYHWLCVNCYQGSQKSVLQRGKRDGSFWLYSCPKCEKSIYGNDDPKRLLITAE